MSGEEEWWRRLREREKKKAVQMERRENCRLYVGRFVLV